MVPVIGSRFPLEATAEAMRQLEAGQATGKTVIEVESGDVAR